VGYLESCKSVERSGEELEKEDDEQSDLSVLSHLRLARDFLSRAISNFYYIKTYIKTFSTFLLVKTNSTAVFENSFVFDKWQPENGTANCSSLGKQDINNIQDADVQYA